jgi:hypothetical protein
MCAFLFRNLYLIAAPICTVTPKKCYFYPSFLSLYKATRADFSIFMQRSVCHVGLINRDFAVNLYE